MSGHVGFIRLLKTRESRTSLKSQFPKPKPQKKRANLGKLQYAQPPVFARAYPKTQSVDLPSAVGTPFGIWKFGVWRFSFL